MTTHFEESLEQIQPQNIFIKIIQKNFEYPTVIFILHNPVKGSKYEKFYCETLKDEMDYTFLIYQKGYKKTPFELKTHNERIITYSQIKE
jgi:hypothetical protein